MTKKFLRRDWNRFSKLGKKKRKKQIWRRARGRDNKIREKRKGYPVKVMIGFKQKKDERNLIEKKKPILVNNLRDLEKVEKKNIVIIGKIGKKKKIEMIKKAKEKGILIYNVNIKKFLKDLKKEKEAKEKEKKELEAKKTKKEKKKQGTKSPTSSAEASSNERKETKKEIVKDIEKSGVSEKVAEAEEALDEKAQEEEK